MFFKRGNDLYCFSRKKLKGNAVPYLAQIQSDGLAKVFSLKRFLDCNDLFFIRFKCQVAFCSKMFAFNTSVTWLVVLPQHV